MTESIEPSGRITDEHRVVAGDDVDPDAVDLDAIERDLDHAEAALARLDDGTYWTDEVTGGPIPDDVLADNPTARRA